VLNRLSLNKIKDNNENCPVGNELENEIMKIKGEIMLG
jgi:hypothetical protein